MHGWGYSQKKKKRSDINYALSDQMNWTVIKLAAAPRALGSCLCWGDTVFIKSCVRFSSVWLSMFAVLQPCNNVVLGSNVTHKGRCTKEGHVGFGADPALLTVITPLRLSGGWSCYRCFMTGAKEWLFILSLWWGADLWCNSMIPFKRAFPHTFTPFPHPVKHTYKQQTDEFNRMCFCRLLSGSQSYCLHLWE